MTIPARFSQLLQAFIKRDGRRVRQLAQATADRFGPLQATAHNTISRWTSPRSQRLMVL